MGSKRRNSKKISLLTSTRSFMSSFPFGKYENLIYDNWGLELILQIMKCFMPFIWIKKEGCIYERYKFYT